MTKGTFQAGGADSVELGENQVRPRDSQMGTKGSFQYAGADAMPTNEHDVDPPYSNEKEKGTFQYGGADHMDPKQTGRSFAFSEQGQGSKVESTGKT
jgi:hypothetical protein